MKSLRPLRIAALVLAALPLAACQQGKDDSGQAAAPDAKPGITVSDARLVLPAVKGNPAAAYFTVRNGDAVATSLAAVHIEGAGKTEIHQTTDGKMAPVNWVELEAGTEVKLAPGGVHVMVFDLGDQLVAGGKGEMTVTFSGGDKVSAPLAIEPAGGADMAGMDHGAAH